MRKHFVNTQCKQKGQFSILILVGILVVATIATGAYFLGKSGKSESTKVVTQPQLTPAPAEVPIEEIEEISNWKTYTNSKYGYSVKYPETWKITEDSLSETSSLIVKGQPFKIIRIRKGEGINTEITINPEGLIVFNPNPEAQKVTGKVGKMNVTRYYFTNNIGVLVEWYRDFGNTKLTVFTIETYINKDDLKTVNQILSTFRFTD